MAMVASLAWSMVPIAPSATTTRSANAVRSALISPPNLGIYREDFLGYVASGMTRHRSPNE
jgi:hypothetical protein